MKPGPLTGIMSGGMRCDLKNASLGVSSMWWAISQQLSVILWQLWVIGLCDSGLLTPPRARARVRCYLCTPVPEALYKATFKRVLQTVKGFTFV